MHTTVIDEFTIHHNGGYEGDVKINFKADAQTKHDLPIIQTYDAGPDFDVYYEVTLPFDVIRNLYLDYLRQKRISDLENVGNAEFETWLI